MSEHPGYHRASRGTQRDLLSQVSAVPSRPEKHPEPMKSSTAACNTALRKAQHRGMLVRVRSSTARHEEPSVGPTSGECWLESTGLGAQAHLSSRRLGADWEQPSALAKLKPAVPWYQLSAPTRASKPCRQHVESVARPRAGGTCDREEALLVSAVLTIQSGFCSSSQEF